MRSPLSSAYHGKRWLRSSPGTLIDYLDYPDRIDIRHRGEITIRERAMAEPSIMFYYKST
jgi:hypothetical protein